MKMITSWLPVIKQNVKLNEKGYKNLQTMDITAIQSIVDFDDGQMF